MPTRKGIAEPRRLLGIPDKVALVGVILLATTLSMNHHPL